MGTLNSAHRGYKYQDLITAYHFTLAIIKQIDEITVDKKLYDGDRFDDLTFCLDERIIRQQIKSSVDEETYFELRHLTTKHRDLEIDELIRGFKKAGDVKADEYRICATWKEPVDELLPLLFPITNPRTFDNFPTKLFCLNTEEIWRDGENPTWTRLKNANDISRQDFLDFAERFVIELEFPSASIDLSVPGELENLLLDLLTNRIGIGTYPNNLRAPFDVAVQLVNFASIARANSKTVTISEIESAIRLQKDFGRISQTFPVEKAFEVERTQLQKDLVQSIKESRVILTGTPGAGKSWALTELADSLKESGKVVARHYCYLEPGDPQVQRRITTDVLFGNLIYELTENNPELKRLHQPIYASGSRELEQLLESGVSEGIIDECILIVDGVDHISRVFAEVKDLSKYEVDIVDELAMLSLPKGVCLIIGSQPGEHLEPLRRENAFEITVPEWSKSEVVSLANKIGLNNLVIKNQISAEDIGKFYEILFIRSEGNPLYATFLCKQIFNDLQNDEITDLLNHLEDAPQINGQISNYYKYLFEGLEQDTFGLVIAELLGTIDFGLTENEINEIYPPFASHIKNAIAFLMPILVQTSGQGGIRIYHESFRRFVNEKIIERGDSVSATLQPVIKWLKERDFFNDAKSYRFLLPCLRRAEQNQELLKTVNTDFVSQSIYYGHPHRAIEENIKLATYVATEELDWASIIRLAELRRSLIVCFEEKLLDIEKYARTFSAVFSPSLLNERLLFDGKATFPPQVGLILCSLCEDAGEAPPWEIYLNLEEPVKRNSYGDYDATDSDETVTAASVARIQGLLRTQHIESVYQRFLSYLQRAIRVHPETFRLGLRKFGEFGGAEILEKILKSAELLDELKTILLIELSRFLYSENKKETAKSVATDAARLSSSMKLLDETYSLGAEQEIVAERICNLNEIDIAVDERKFISDDNKIEDWVYGVKLASGLSPELLDSERLRIQGESWYRGWLRFVIALAEAENEVDVDEAEKATLEALENLASDTRPFAGKPRTCDLYFIRSVIHETIVRALLLINKPEGWNIALKHLKKISIETSGLLIPGKLIELLIPYASNKSLGNLITDFLRTTVRETQKSHEYYENQAEQEMILANILADSVERSESHKYWESACIKLCGYGYRKDITIFELIESVPSLKTCDQTQAKEAVSSVQPLVNAVIQHTDGKETQHSLVAWFSSLCEIDEIGASFILANSLVRFGGAIDWRYEECLEEFVDFVYDSGDAHLVNLLTLTQPFEGNTKKLQQRLKIIERIIEVDFPNGEHFLRLFATQIRGDADFHSTAHEIVREFGESHKIHLPEVDKSITKQIKKQKNSFGSTDNPFDKFEDKTIFPKDVSFSQIVFTLRANRSKLREEKPENNRFVNAFGYRLLEMIEAGENEKAVQLLQYFSRISDFNYKAASPLAEIGEGLERYGYKEEASIAFSLAYARSRGGNGWLAMGDAEQLFWLEHSFSLSGESGERTLANELVYWLNDKHQIWGITRHLIEFCAKLKPDIAFDVWQSAFDVIQHRLPDSHADSKLLDSYKPNSVPKWTVDEAIIGLLFARISHPELRRKTSALAGIAFVFNHYSEIVISPLIHFLTLNTPVTSVLLVLNILVEAEQKPYAITKAIEKELLNLSKSGLFGFQILAQTLLERIEVSTELLITDISNSKKSSDLTGNRIEAIISLDWNKRVSNIEKIWNEFPDLVAQRFDYIWENHQNAKDFAESRYKAARSLSYPDLPPTPFLFWEEEIFEYVFHEILSEIHAKKNFEEGETPFFNNNAIGSQILSNVHIHIANWHSRTTRPFFPMPSEQVSSIELVQPIDEEDEFEGWYRCGYFERELVISEARTFEGFVIVMKGVDFQEDLPSFSIHPPFADTRGNNWWINYEWDIDPATFRGPIVGLRWKKDLLGILPVLVLHPALASMVKLKPIKEWQTPLVLVDKDEEVCVRFRSWHTNKIGNTIGEENSKLEGCDLIMRADVFEELVNGIGINYRNIKFIA